MHVSPEALQAARMAALEGAILGLLRDAVGDDLDGVSIVAEADAGQVVIDVTYTHKGIPVAGESL
ncbi:hypothetical protein CKY39_16010 [Variovorax boronicumulans]|uniref:Uncharacterized protein n=1 Tax=Variovorax boronicumulans TaxID=436515 RepID=A0A250DJK0_9BURK|nr:hypothetical protein [Variovorax boronicumulans]ATA54545.1 hypothetical protein CKY39_16010 [Variovorax boronicumulans]